MIKSTQHGCVAEEPRAIDANTWTCSMDGQSVRSKESCGDLCVSVCVYIWEKQNSSSFLTGISVVSSHNATRLLVNFFKGRAHL